MKPELKLFFDFEFTSLSPDAQPISLGIVSEVKYTQEFIAAGHCGVVNVPKKIESKSFYAEFLDFDMNRCDDWVKENVVSKLKYVLTYYHNSDYKCDPLPEKEKNVFWSREDGNDLVLAKTSDIKEALKDWLSQFSYYNIQFVADCGTWDWYWMLQLLAGWDEIKKEWCIRCGYDGGEDEIKIGLPKLPDSISPIPEDLNDLIAHKKGISVREAFDLSREELLCPMLIIDETSIPELDKNELLREMRKTGVVMLRGELDEIKSTIGDNPKHNALWDAKVIKAIYEKLK